MGIQMQAGSSSSGDQKQFDPIPKDTIVNVKVERCEIREVDRAVTPWKEWDQEVSFAFVVQDGDYKKRWLWGNVPAILDNSNRCTLRLWLQSILKVPNLAEAFPGGYDFEPQDIVGKTAQVLVDTYFSKKKQTIENTVGDVLPDTGVPAVADSAAAPAEEYF